jgi:glycosyltransferase involved in cell wall biosynthesis
MGFAGGGRMSVATTETELPAGTQVARGVRRVCLITEAAGGGVGRHFLDLAEGLARRGIEVVAIYSPGRCDAQFRERRERIEGVRFVELAMRRAVQPGDLVDLARLIACVREHQPCDIIHGHSSKGGALARLAGQYLKIPAIYTPHAFVTLDPTLSRFKRGVYGRVERWLSRHATGVIAVSPDEAEHAEALGIEPASIHVVPNGIEPADFPAAGDARAQVGLSADDFVVGFVGRLVPQKAPDLLVEAFARVARRVPHARLVLVGSGPLDGAVRTRIDALGLTAKTRLVGDQIATRLLPAFDVFCLSSRYEGMTYVLLEALAAGLPIVATRVGGVSLCVESEQNGLIVEVGDAGALSDALLRLANDPVERLSFALSSAARSSRFTADKMVEDTLGVYEVVASSRRSAWVGSSIGC